MKKFIAVLVAGTFIIGAAIAQTPATSAAKPAEKKETAAPQKSTEKKDATGSQKTEGKKKHHSNSKGTKTEAKAETKTPEKK